MIAPPAVVIRVKVMCRECRGRIVNQAVSFGLAVVSTTNAFFHVSAVLVVSSAWHPWPRTQTMATWSRWIAFWGCMVPRWSSLPR